MSKREPIRDLKKRIEIASYKYGLRGEDIQDAAQEILLRLHEGKHKHSTVDQMLIDYLRTQSGRKGTVSYDTRKALVKPQRLQPDNKSDRGFIDRDQFRDLEYGVDVGIYARLVNGETDKVIFKLLYKWGFCATEIADIFDVDPSRISQRIKRIQESIQQRIKTKELLKDKGNLEKVLSEKTEGNSWGVESFKNIIVEKIESW